jgi:hypothetical protein
MTVRLSSMGDSDMTSELAYSAPSPTLRANSSDPRRNWPAHGAARPSKGSNQLPGKRSLDGEEKEVDNASAKRIR